jgi:putative transposase
MEVRNPVYHCLSRVVDRRFIFGDSEKELFRSLMLELAAFCQVRILTYCLMSNHFHILVEVPRPPDPLPTAEETLDALARLSGCQDVRETRRRLQSFRELGDAEAEAAWLAGIHARRWSLSAFIKLLKQRFSYTYNRLSGRQGTLWEDRFKSVLVEGQGDALVTMAAYIDLNPIRAGLVADPKDYRWCGYGEAVAGSQGARAGLRRIMEALLRKEEPEDGEALAAYRRYLYLEGNENRESIASNGQLSRGALPRETVLQVLAKQGRLSPAEFLRCRIRYFCEGAVLGSRGFVEEISRTCRERFGLRKKPEARSVGGMDGVELYSLQRLRGAAFR